MSVKVSRIVDDKSWYKATTHTEDVMTTLDRIRNVILESQMGALECEDALVLLSLFEQEMREKASRGEYRAVVMEAFNCEPLRND